ncbi:dynamin family protein [Oceanobacillus arenosus]|nr:dynamin family protein [Oceanobacillus arenosus]
MKLKEEIKSQTTFPHLVALYQLMIDNGDQATAEKIIDLYEKLEKEEFTISFSGHFSAGKSSMINALIGADLLAKSPVPTSANIVKISAGDGSALVYFHNDDVIEFKEPYDLDMIKAYSMDKDTIKKIEIRTSEDVIPAGVSIMDTPGIDAADDADRLITEASLHLVDVLFYVMDYNHVQSEVNLRFLKSIQEKGIPFYTIINQIDKHDESEISFKQYVSKIKQTFDQWNLFPKDIYFTSLLDETIQYSQFSRLKHFLYEQIFEGKNRLFQMDQSIQQVVSEHKGFLKQKYEESTIDLNPYTTTQIETSKLEIESLTTRMDELQQIPLAFEKDFNHEIHATLDNAYIMPASLRDKVESFLESQQKNFKVGFFSSAKKIADEKNNRLSDFLSTLQGNIDALIQWKLREKILKLANQYGIQNSDLQKQIQALSIIFNATDIIEIIKSGAKVNGDYVLIYTKDVTADIKQKFNQAAKQLLGRLKTNLEEELRVKIEKVNSLLVEHKQILATQGKYDSLQVELDAQYRQLEQQLESPNPSQFAYELLETAREKQQNMIKQVSSPLPNAITVKESEPEERHREETKQAKNFELDSILKNLEETIHVIEDLPSFASLKQDLMNRQDQLTNRTFTIALFGAFSAGKSSFANALMGENVLPVSPNPTTAVVNRIRPVTETSKHGDVIISLKDEDSLVNDLRLITKKFSPKEMTLEGLLAWVKANRIHQDEKLNKMYQSHLQAMLAGFEANQANIGKQLTISLEEFAAYVTDETMACYFEAIDLYYDCSLTRQGIVLVDTPGADSVNARHTNVAFDYIKHADAILYVTYYNHALSRADRDFLLQLGRVKESFELDKMFFIVNAADLASDQKELEMVTDYVQEQLLQLGIRLPNLYPVSSKNALIDKQSNQRLNQQMQYFENHFYQFIHHDLTALTVESARWDITRTFQTMKHSIETLQLDENQKDAYKQRLIMKKEQLVTEITSIKATVNEERLIQKIDKQLYFVIERLSIRFHDMYKEFFNPTTVTDSGRMARVQLRNNLEGLIDYVANELYQELQAISLRIEQFTQGEVSNVYKYIMNKGKQADSIFVLPNFSGFDMETPKYEHGFYSLDFGIFDGAIATFKGTKAFFEKNEKEQLKEQLYTILLPIVKDYINLNKATMLEYYVEALNRFVMDIKDNAIDSVTVLLDSHLKMMVTAMELSILSEKEEKLKAIIEQ